LVIRSKKGHRNYNKLFLNRPPENAGFEALGPGGNPKEYGKKKTKQKIPTKTPNPPYFSKRIKDMGGKGPGKTKTQKKMVDAKPNP